MQKKKQSGTRRQFIKQISGTSLALGVGSFSAFANDEAIEERIIHYQKNIAANNQINIAVIGMGIMGFNNTQTALKIPGVQLVAVCDLYAGRLERAKEVYGKNLFVTNDYRKILDRKDIDAVIISTSDHFHARITIDALQKGKHVYCEKPMVHLIKEGQAVINAQKASNKIMQVGSQRVSSLIYAKANELYKAGEIGKLNMVNAIYDRQDALGAWQYTMPADESAETVDWDRYIAGMEKIQYDAKKFFWWRNYQAFGTGIAGDLFVHLLSGTHVITGAKGPESIYAAGQLCYWKDGRDVPDVMTGIMQYPETPEHSPFQLTLQVNFVSGTGGTELIRFTGDEGTMDIGYDSLTIRHNKMAKAPGIGGWDALTTYPKTMQDTLRQNYNNRYTPEEIKREQKPDIIYKEPANFDEHLQHFIVFFDSIRSGKPVVEDATFGFRAAAPCLACNESYFKKKVIYWDADKMEVKEN